ncbi:PhzF family phenazine biosynthesis isomerase [Marinilactibacillus sp. GCM10026970]|uniref:PhzF family phenazine biosynthesis isomerase n=1 Tax=Marinilactibacillus sp. GCM10026970 TaxID=3252642 RepID=UPI00360AD01A
MNSVMVYHYDVFNKEANKGNPAGIVLNGDDLTDEMMQEVALRVGFNETAFPVKSDVADLRIRFFTPGSEVDLCGHATIATIFALKIEGLLGDKTAITIETASGILSVQIILTSDNEILIAMKQMPPQFEAFKGSKEALADLIGLTTDDFDNTLPILYGSTGAWTLLLPIKNLEVFRKMKSNNTLFPAILREIPKASIHPFCLDTYNPDAHMHGRHFSSPYSGSTEDPVTGTASGIMGAYYAQYINSNLEDTLDLIVEQGHEIKKEGQVMVRVSKNKDNIDVEIAGTAVYVNEFEVII